MLAIELGALAILLASAVCGHTAWLLVRPAEAVPAWAPAAGFALLLGAGDLLLRAPGHATGVAIACALLGAGPLASRPVRRSLRAGAPQRLVVGGATLALASLPFAVSGAGILGVGRNNDPSAHLAAAWWLNSGRGPEPVGALGDKLVSAGYPMGPHGLAGALASLPGISLVHGLDAVMVVVPVLTALAALAVLGGAPIARGVAAVAVALCYLAASYLAQASFKEPIEALLLLAFALALGDLVAAGPRRIRDGVPAGLLAAGTVFDYGLPGLVWPAAAGAAILAVELVRRRGRLLRALPAAGGLVVVVAAAVGASLPHALTLLSSGFANEPKTNTGNLVTALSPFEALGVWLRADFRFLPHHAALSKDLDALAALAGAIGLAWWARARTLALPAALAAAVVIAWQAREHRNIYNAAKALMVVAPVAALAVAAPLAAAWGRGGRRLLRVPVRVVSVVLLAGAATSTFYVLRDAPVGPTEHARELDRMRALIGGRSVLFLGIDDYAQWELRGTRLGSGWSFYEPDLVPTRFAKGWRPPAPYDIDSFAPSQIDRFAFVLIAGGAYTSSMPRNLHLVARTRSYALYRRSGPTTFREIVEPPDAPGAPLDCTTIRARRYRRHGGVAGVLPTPVVGTQAGWRGQPFRPGQSAVQAVRVPAGTWDLSLQYASRTGLAIVAGDLRASLPASMDRVGPYWPVGVVRLRHGRRLAIRVTARQPGLVARLLGARGPTRALDLPGHVPVAGVALTRRGARPRLVPVARACGRYVDFLSAG